jgi:hypothetical protein
VWFDTKKLYSIGISLRKMFEKLVEASKTFWRKRMLEMWKKL